MLQLRRKATIDKANGPPSKMQQAIETRRQQGRGALDDWDMFANVMATRASLPVTHPSHLNLQQVTERTAHEVHKQTGLPLPDQFQVSDSSGHASTGGGYNTRGQWSGDVTLTMKQDYGNKALSDITSKEDTTRFRKMVRTVSHEMTHVGQRRDATFMQTHKTGPERELATYSSEIIAHPSLPALTGSQLVSTGKKFNRKLGEVESTRIGQGRGITQDEVRLATQVRQTVATGKGVGK